MLYLVTRNNPESHIMLRQIVNFARNEKDCFISYKKILLFYIVKIERTSKSSEVLRLSDDPISFLFAFLYFWFKPVDLWYLEISEHQVGLNIRSFPRYLIFRLATFLSVWLCRSLYVPSRLRLDYLIKAFPSFFGIGKKSKVLYNVNLDMPTPHELPYKERVNRAVYAGAIQQGRVIEDIVKDAERRGVKLFICGRVSDGYLDAFQLLISKYSNSTYLGVLDKDSLQNLYESCEYGYLSYDNSPLNTKYCAPVKIFEYFSNRLKILGNSNYALMNEWSYFIDEFYDLEKLELNQTRLSVDSDKALRIFQDAEKSMKEFLQHYVS